MKKRTVEVEAHPGASRDKVEIKNNVIHIYTTRVAEKGKANKAIRKLLAKHLKLPVSFIILVKGEKSKHKVFRLDQ